MEEAILGAGCFWCIEAIFQDLNGVEKAISGYSGGNIKNPSYKEVCTGRTGHAEVVKVIFDSKVITFAEILEVFWKVHDPTTLNRQGNDVGTQYRSAIFYTTPTQKQIAEDLKEKLNQSGAFKNPVITEITPFSNFFPAENYHTDYFNLHQEEPYCQLVVKPKVEKFKKAFKNKLK